MASKTLDFAGKRIALQKQDQLAWCYAAVVSVVSHWLTNNAGWTPCQIVSWAMVQNLRLGAQAVAVQTAACNCCGRAKPHACLTATAVSKLRPVLTHLNIAYNRIPGAPGMRAVKKEIDADRPILLALAKVGGGPGHVSLIVGYNDTTSKFVIFDPAANVIPVYKDRTDLRTMCFEVTPEELQGRFPTARHRVDGRYINLILGGGGLTAPLAWAVY